MKKIITAVLALMLSSTLLVAAEVKDQKMADDMKEMMNAMVEIQKNWFYENPRGIKKGVKKLEAHMEYLKSSDAKGYLPKDQEYANKFAKKRAEMIELYAEDLVVSVEDGNDEDVLDNYTQIMNQCTSCHMRIRNW